MKTSLSICFLVAILMVPTLSYANLKSNIKPEVINNIFNRIKSNNYWKNAIVTGENAQVVLMSISPQTNPKNEFGIDTNESDLIIIVLEGNGKASLNAKVSAIKENDMIFVPEGTAYNIINTNKNKALKLVTIYSETDVPANTILETKASITSD